MGLHVVLVTGPPSGGFVAAEAICKGCSAAAAFEDLEAVVVTAIGEADVGVGFECGVFGVE